ncbi:hypothetical protein BDZ97DRAFT_1763966 [Flammula alnicola]|nr:hypothetical protein BDZ97DRAFT_1763966 [Flammula alnicola]
MEAAFKSEEDAPKECLPDTNNSIDEKQLSSEGNSNSNPADIENVARQPMDKSQRMALRIKPMDNLRTTLIVLLILQHAILETVSDSPNPFQLDETSPRSLTFLMLFEAINRNIVVAMLFFISGFASKFSMSIRSATPLHFLFKKTWKTGLALIGYHVSTFVTEYLYGPWPEMGSSDTKMPYYSLQQGKKALLQGPSFYIMALLALDYIYAICRTMNILIYQENCNKHFISTTLRYRVAKYTLFISVEGWMIFFAAGLIRPSERVKEWLYITNSAELHFPVLYLISYVAGIQFISYYKFLLGEAPKRFSVITLVTRILIYSGVMYAIYRHFPQTLHRYLDLRTQPPLAFTDAGIHASDSAPSFYGAWSAVVLMLFPSSLISAFYTTRALSKDWGIISRTSYIQTYVHMVFVIGFAQRAGWITNLLWRCVYVGTGSIVCGWLVVLIPVMGYRTAVGIWKKLRSHGSRLDEEKV